MCISQISSKKKILSSHMKCFLESNVLIPSTRDDPITQKPYWQETHFF